MNLRLMASGRTGNYVKQPTGYKAFIPKKLSADLDINIDGEMQSLLSKADRAIGRLDGSIQTLPNPDLFILMYVRKEAVLSSQIEGTQSSLTDVLNAEANVKGIRLPGDVGEVINYTEALNYGVERLKSLPISTRLIREIHEKLMQNVRGEELNPGEIRTSQNWIGPSSCTLNEASFVPPPPHELHNTLSDLEYFIHAIDDLPFLIKVAIVHAQFETIHPFLDGNGRVGRLLITFLMSERAIITKPVLYISHYFKANRSEYYERLQNVRDKGDWENWIKFFLKGMASVSNEATETARQIVDLRERHRLQLTAELGRATGNGLKLLESLYEFPTVNVNIVASLLEMTHAGANQIVRKFSDLGILQEITGQGRNRVFRYVEYINLF